MVEKLFTTIIQQSVVTKPNTTFTHLVACASPPPPSPVASPFKYFMVHAEKILSSSLLSEVEIFP